MLNLLIGNQYIPKQEIVSVRNSARPVIQFNQSKWLLALSPAHLSSFGDEDGPSLSTSAVS